MLIQDYTVFNDRAFQNAFFYKAGLFQYPHGAGIIPKNACLDAHNVEMGKSIGSDQLYGSRHDPLPPAGLGEPVADERGFAVNIIPHFNPYRAAKLPININDEITLRALVDHPICPGNGIVQRIGRRKTVQQVRRHIDIVGILMQRIRIADPPVTEGKTWSFNLHFVTKEG